MYVKIGRYVNWVGPFQIADAVFFWCRKYPSDKMRSRLDYRLKDKLGEFLAYGFKGRPKRDRPFSRKRIRDERKTWFYTLLEWIHSKKTRKIDIRIDQWDTWSMDKTLAMIILPMLKQLQETKHGSAIVELEDVPEHMRTPDAEDGQEPPKYDTHDRWDWVLKEMIWAFEQMQPDCDWEAQYHTGVIDIEWEPDTSRLKEDGTPMCYTMVRGPNDTHKIDTDGITRHQARIDNGTRLFGKYFQGLWD